MSCCVSTFELYCLSLYATVLRIEKPTIACLIAKGPAGLYFAPHVAFFDI